MSGGQSQFVQLRFASPLPLLPGDRFVVRANVADAGGGRLATIGGGQILGLSNTRQEGTDGRFIFLGLPAGAVSLEAWDPDTRQTGHATVQVAENAPTELTIAASTAASGVRTRKSFSALSRCASARQGRKC